MWPLLKLRHGPCQKLTSEGLVFMKVPKGEASLRRITCKDTSMQHYNMTGATFRVDGNSVTYFGDVEIEWTNRGGFKTSDMFGAIGAIISESHNDGSIKMSVRNDGLEEIKKAYEKQVGQEANPKRSLLKSIQ